MNQFQYYGYDAAIAHEVRRRLINYEYPPGSVVPAASIANSMSMEISAVYTACRQLVTEGWLILTLSDEFIVWNVDDAALIGQYDFAGALLSSVVDRLPDGNPQSDLEYAVVRLVAHNVRRESQGKEEFAIYSGALFFALAALTKTRQLMEITQGSNERLFYLRQLERRLLKNSSDDLIDLCELVLAGRRKGLKEAIGSFHRRRRDWIRNLSGQLAG